MIRKACGVCVCDGCASVFRSLSIIYVDRYSAVINVLKDGKYGCAQGGFCLLGITLG